MNLVSDESVHLVVTSPPYWQLKDYGSSDQIGFNDCYESYINHLNLVWQECFRVLHNGCRLCVNIGDQFARAVYYGRYKVIPIREEIIKFCEIIGFDYMGAIIWQKKTNSHSTGGGIQMGSYPYPRNGVLKIDYEFILLLKKTGNGPKPTREQKELSRLSNEEWNSFFSGHWNFAGAKQNSHIAMFPDELPLRLIKMFSFVGETVLDPFAGSGTTTVAAQKLQRNSVGYEINNDFISIIKEKTQSSNVAETVLKFETDMPVSGFEESINKLPYIFKDPHHLNNKLDPKQQTFGSRIDTSGPISREELFTVKEVISPETFRLNDGKEIRLIGIKVSTAEKQKAISFLQNKLKGKKVYLKLDDKLPSADQVTSCYLYLQNRTFINAHLIKHGLATVDEDCDFRYKKKFVALSNMVRRSAE
ncbi:MAG TPA: DNA methyltransferase [Chitinophagaceae bacterium]|nr:DNA methyltransferase [Chitinophagaceae bacterium]